MLMKLPIDVLHAGPEQGGRLHGVRVQWTLEAPCPLNARL